MIQSKKGMSVWIWILIILILAAIGIVVFLFLGNGTSIIPGTASPLQPPSLPQ